MYFLLNMGIFQPAMLVYQRVGVPNFCYEETTKIVAKRNEEVNHIGSFLRCDILGDRLIPEQLL